MKISTKGRYGLRAVLDIAMHDEAASVSSIAARQFISENYLERLIAMLKKAGIVNSPVDCSEIDGSLCEGSDTCVTKFVWKRISDSIKQAVDNLMISELANEGKHLLEENGCDKNSIPVCNRK